MIENSFDRALEAETGARNTPLTMLALYEDAETRSVAESIYLRLVKAQGHEFDFDCTWCGLDDLLHPDVAAHTTVVAMDADLILFAVRGGVAPSVALQAWLGNWIACKAAQDCALVLIVVENSNKKRTTPYVAYLDDAARRGRMEFLPHFIRLPAETNGGEVALGLPRAAPRIST
jgi:hypothetical protein